MDCKFSTLRPLIQLRILNYDSVMRRGLNTDYTDSTDFIRLRIMNFEVGENTEAILNS